MAGPRVQYSGCKLKPWHSDDSCATAGYLHNWCWSINLNFTTILLFLTFAFPFLCTRLLNMFWIFLLCKLSKVSLFFKNEKFKWIKNQTIQEANVIWLNLFISSIKISYTEAYGMNILKWEAKFFAYICNNHI